MEMTITITSCSSTFRSLPISPSSKYPLKTISKQFLTIDKNLSTSKSPLLLSASSKSSTPTIKEDGQYLETNELPGDSEPSSDSLSFNRGCKACGREEIERGCNGEGRIQGGIATFPGFGWWPIKAYRPCPGLVVSGGQYRRTGQSLDEIGFGAGDLGRPTKVKKSSKKNKEGG